MEPRVVGGVRIHVKNKNTGGAPKGQPKKPAQNHHASRADGTGQAGMSAKKKPPVGGGHQHHGHGHANGTAAKNATAKGHAGGLKKSKGDQSHHEHLGQKEIRQAKEEIEQEEEEAEKEEEEEEEEATCLICCEPLDYYSVGECEHGMVCSLCTLRRRGLYKDFQCCICKQELDKVVFTKNGKASFKSLKLPELYDPTSKCYFEDPAHYDRAQKLWQFACPVCDKESERPLASLTNLKKHLDKIHHMYYCELCLQHRKIFLSEQKVYTGATLEKHEYGEGEKEVDQHQWCEFCERLFYDKDDIFQHLMKEHFTCHICEKNGIKYHYYKDYRALERHFRKQHFMCEEKSCLEQKFVVFATALDLRAHDLKTHMHERGLSRAELKQAQKLEIGLFLEKPTTKERKSRGRDEPVLIFNPLLPHPPPRQPAHELGPVPAAATASNAGSNTQEKKPKYVKRSEDEQRTTSDANEEKQEKDKVKTRTVKFPPEPLNEEERRTRNAALVVRIKAAIGEGEFPNFKQLSVDLRMAHITPAQYYQKFARLFGSHGPSLFPELVSLLPDPVLRSALTTLHRQAAEKGFPEFQSKSEPPRPQEPPQEAPKPAPPPTSALARGDQAGKTQPVRRTDAGAWGTGPPRSRGAGAPMTAEDFPSLPPSTNTDGDEELARLLEYNLAVGQNGNGKKGAKKSKKGQVLLRFG